MGRILRSDANDSAVDQAANIADLISQIGDVGSEASDLATSYWRSYQEQPTITVPYASPTQEVQHRIDEANNMSSDAVEDYMPESEKEENKSDDEYSEEIFRRLDPSVEALQSSDWSATKDLLSNPIDRNYEAPLFTDSEIDNMFADDKYKKIYEQGFANDEGNPDGLTAKFVNAGVYDEDTANSFDPLGIGKYIYSGFSRPIDPNSIDDGRDPASREALFMTGDQYYKYRTEYGIPGRPVDEIDYSPDTLYNKQDEQENYGFVPYITSKESAEDFLNGAASQFVSNVFNNLADLRRKNTDFTVNYDGKQFSGKDFMKNNKLYSQRISDASDINASTNRDDVGPDASGMMQNPDGTWRFAKADETPMAWADYPLMVLDDGTTLRADQVMDILDEEQGGIDRFADYGLLGMGRPVAENPFTDGVVPWLVDMALGSAPYFWLPTSIVQGLSDANSYMQGIKPGYFDSIDGTYRLMSENPDVEDKLTSVLGSLAMPATERIWGPLGTTFSEMAGAGKGAVPFITRLGKKLGIEHRPAFRLAEGAFGEGLEEIPGNIVEDFREHGVSDWYANPITDSYGNERYDSQGRQLRDSDTRALDRIANFVIDAPLSFLGGAALGGTLGLGDLGKYKNDYLRYQQFGNNLVVPEGLEDIRFNHLSQDEKDYYNDYLDR